MLDFGFYNMDCLEGMKEFPDKYFDLAIVDPPYGNPGGVGSRRTERDSDNDSTDTSDRDQRENLSRRRPRRGLALTPGGGTTLRVRAPKERQKLREPAEHGPRSSEKNHRVGYSARKRIFRRTFPYLT